MVDLGCNAGLFTCLLASRYGKDDITGLLVDADPDVLEECKWHLDANGLENCEAVCAVVGPADAQEADFYISEFNISSSAKPFDESYPIPLQAVKKISRQAVLLEDLIRGAFGDERVHVLKIDIEGSESDLLAQDLSCLEQVDWLVIEWHKWVLSLEDVTAVLSRYELTLTCVLKEDSICGLALYQNENAPA